MDAKVYRPERDWKNQRPEDLEESCIGDVNIVMGGESSQSNRYFPNVVSTEGMIGIARSDVTVEQNDYLKVNGMLYVVTGPRQWDFPNELSGTDFGYYWVEAQSTK